MPATRLLNAVPETADLVELVELVKLSDPIGFVMCAVRSLP